MIVFKKSVKFCNALNLKQQKELFTFIVKYIKLFFMVFVFDIKFNAINGIIFNLPDFLVSNEDPPVKLLRIGEHQNYFES